MHVFILAGGFAPRLWPLPEKRAKPLLPLAGKPLLSYIIDQIPAGMDITISTNAVFAEDFRKWRKDVPREKIEIHIEDAGHEDQKPGALGAVAMWLESNGIDEDLLLVAGDNYSELNIEKFLEHRTDRPLLAAHDIGETGLAQNFGTIIAGEPASGSPTLPVVSFEEKPLHPKSTFVSTGWWFLPKSCLTVLKEHAISHPDNVGGVFEEFLRRDLKVDCYVFDGRWRDIGSFESYMSIHREIVGERAIVDPGSSILAGTELMGSIVIGPNVKIEKSILRDCIVFGKTTILDSVLEGCIIDENCTLESIDLTDKMLRAGTVLRNKGINPKMSGVF